METVGPALAHCWHFAKRPLPTRAVPLHVPTGHEFTTAGSHQISFSDPPHELTHDEPLNFPITYSAQHTAVPPQSPASSQWITLSSPLGSHAAEASWQKPFAADASVQQF